MRAKRVRVERQVIKKCPFCGEMPEAFGRTLNENNEPVAQVRHIPSRICPLSILVFKVEQWNKRV